MTFEQPWRTNSGNIEDSSGHARCRSWLRGAAWLAVLSLVGCGDGSVVAGGRVLIDGAPATGGRLLLTPVGGGPQAFSLVTPEGEFSLRARGDSIGALPGSYRVTFHQPLDEKSRAQLSRDLAGQLSAADMAAVYRGPRDKPLVIPAAGSDQLEIDIRRSDGWQRAIND